MENDPGAGQEPSEEAQLIAEWMLDHHSRYCSRYLPKMEQLKPELRAKDIFAAMYHRPNHILIGPVGEAHCSECHDDRKPNYTDFSHSFYQNLDQLREFIDGFFIGSGVERIVVIEDYQDFEGRKSTGEKGKPLGVLEQAMALPGYAYASLRKERVGEQAYLVLNLAEPTQARLSN